MREEDFPEKIKIAALKRANYRCERCWHNRNLEFHHKVAITLGGTSSLSNCIVLCSDCHVVAPNDPIIFDLFMKFASPKEMIRYYNLETEAQAIEQWCKELGYDQKDIFDRIEKAYPSRKDLVKGGMRKRVIGGGFAGFAIPYGYDYKDGKLTINQDEAKIVRYMFKKYLEGATLSNIIVDLHSKNILTKHGKKWGKQTIAGILKNPLYCGYIEWEDIIKKGEHQIIVSKESFNKAQEILLMRTKKLGKRQKIYLK